MLFLLFQLGNDHYALDVAQIAEVMPLVGITRIPQAPPGVAGMFDCRGVPVPVIDLSQLMLGRPAQSRLSTRIIVVELSRRHRRNTPTRLDCGTRHRDDAARAGRLRRCRCDQRWRAVSGAGGRRRPWARAMGRGEQAPAGIRAGRVVQTAGRNVMAIPDFASLLKQSMGLDAASIGSAAIERAVDERRSICGLKDPLAYWELVRDVRGGAAGVD